MTTGACIAVKLAARSRSLSARSVFWGASSEPDLGEPSQQRVVRRAYPNRARPRQADEADRSGTACEDDRLPRPGEYYAAPALAALLRTTPADQLADRFSGHEAGVIGDAALPAPNVLLVITESVRPTMLRRNSRFFAAAKSRKTRLRSLRTGMGTASGIAAAGVPGRSE